MTARPFRHVYGVEVLSVLAALGWAIFLWFDTAIYPTGVAYRAMREIAPAHLWAVLMFVGFMVQLAALVSQQWQAIFVADLAATVVWTFIAIQITQADPLSVAVWVYGPIALLQTYRFWPRRLQVL